MIHKICLAGFLIIASSACEDSKNKSDLPVEVAPSTCQTIALLGSFPQTGAAEDNSYAYACFEGYELTDNRKVWLADQKCREGAAIAETGSEEGKLFKKLEGSSCPTEGVVASCETGTSKVFVYDDLKNLFNQDNFEKYCASKGGTLKI